MVSVIFQTSHWGLYKGSNKDMECAPAIMDEYCPPTDFAHHPLIELQIIEALF